MTTDEGQAALSAEAFTNWLRREGLKRYHHEHPFHVLMHQGKLTQHHLQQWILNRYYYQTRIPIKDALILSKSDDPAPLSKTDEQAMNSRVQMHPGILLILIQFKTRTGQTTERMVTMMKTSLPALVLTSIASLLMATQAHADLNLGQITLPPGFEISLYAKDVPNARGMTLGENGTVFVGTKKEGAVYAVVDQDGDHRADAVHTIARDLHMPVGVTYKDGSLYVSAVDRIVRFDRIEQHLTNPPAAVLVTDRLPQETKHGWKYIGFGPDKKLYVAVGAPCNSCEPDRDRHALIARLNQDGSGYEIVARGIRNTVGFDWDPTTKELWFTENGRDWLGDNQPPDELNHAPTTGMDFGYPYCHGSSIPDPEYGTKHPCSDFTPPVVNLDPHVAALGMRFYTGNMFPAEYRNQIFIAEHGSWNRSEKIGYRITLASRDKEGRFGYSVFAQGWLQGTEAWGRPVDVLVMPDGALLVSDDMAGVIYRIAYRKH
jgi:glucose/arabinose dehydrogenase